MRKSCAAKADSCNGSAKVPVTQCMFGAVSIGLGLAAATGTGASGAERSGSSLRWASAARSRGISRVSPELTPGSARRDGGARGSYLHNPMPYVFSPDHATSRFNTLGN